METMDVITADQRFITKTMRRKYNVRQIHSLSCVGKIDIVVILYVHILVTLISIARSRKNVNGQLCLSY